MRPGCRVGLVGAVLLPLLCGIRGEATEANLGVSLYPGSQSVPELRLRLEGLQTSRWVAMDVFHVDAPLGEVIKHFRRQRAAAAPSTIEPSGRLKEWLERNPEEKEHYREFREAQAGALTGPAEPWEILPMTAAEIPTSLGGGAALSPQIAARPVEMSYGKILLADAVVSVQLLSPHPTGDGRSLSSGTLVALIREARPDAGQTPAASEETIAGPETKGLGSRLSGWVVMDFPIGGIQTVSLPSGSPATVRPPERASGVVHALAGPDDEGRIVYIENHATESRHALKTVRLSGGDERMIFSRKGDAFLERAVGTSVALSRSGGRVALVGPLSRYETNRPPYPLRTGPLELWDLETRSGRETGIQALDRRVAWFPDGVRIAYVALVPRPRVETPLDAEDRFGSGFSGSDAVPVVHIFDTSRERGRALHAGWDPVVSEDGRRVVVRDSDGRLRSVDVETGRFESIRLPGEAGGVVAVSAEGLALYWALPTAGSPPEFTRGWSSMVGPRPMKTLKVADLATGRFETVLSSIDPRRDLTFGASR